MSTFFKTSSKLATSMPDKVGQHTPLCTCITFESTLSYTRIEIHITYYRQSIRLKATPSKFDIVDDVEQQA